MSWVRPDLHDAMVDFVVGEWHRLAQERGYRLGKTKLRAGSRQSPLTLTRAAWWPAWYTERRRSRRGVSG